MAILSHQSFLGVTKELMLLWLGVFSAYDDIPMIHHLLDFVFPRTSLSGVEGEWLTEEERRQLKVHPYVEWTEDLRARGLHSLDHLVAACHYQKDAHIQKAVHTFKYKRIPVLALDLARMIAEAADSVGRPTSIPLCAVPLHWTRQFARGFNQAELLAAEISRVKKIPMAYHLLKRTRPTGHQAHRQRSARLSSLHGAFSVGEGIVSERVVLIDDLSTTGATLDECARVLKDAGAKWVEGWVVAQG